MDDRRLVRISKYLSRHLRHRPKDLGLTLALGGWVAVDQLLKASARKGFPITHAELREVVARNDKQRLAFDPTGTRIRANQGHSVAVDLELEPAIPPALLYHGTGHGSVESIAKQGLSRMSRHHVHLSIDLATAEKVRARHGHPVVFAVDAAAMHQAGYTFYCSVNGVWLVESVPPQFLEQVFPTT